MSSLQMKTVLITGASLGIGRALALDLARRGANLVLNARGGAELEKAATACRELGARVEVVAGDCAESGTVRQMVTRAQDFGGFTGFVHAAGALKPGPLLTEMDEAAFDEVLAGHVRGAYLLARHAYPLLRGHGWAVFFGSGAATMAQPGIAAYCIAKAAEEHLMRQLAEEEPEVAAFAYQPGIVETRMQVEARQAQGGGAQRLHNVFRPWKEQGLLLAPEQAAGFLADILDADPRVHHGQVVRVRV